MLLAIRPETGHIELLAAPAERMALSPDGKVLAFYQNGAVGMIHLGRDITVYRRVNWDEPSFLLDMRWQDDETLLAPVITLTEKASTDIAIHRLRPDGAILTPLETSIDGNPFEYYPDLMPTALATSPDGERVVIGLPNSLIFMDADGPLAHVTPERGHYYAAPIFSPDGKTVLVKHSMIVQGQQQSAQSLKFFSPSGEELSEIMEPAWADAQTGGTGIPGPAPLPTGPPVYTMPADKLLLVDVRDRGEMPPQAQPNERVQSFTRLLVEKLTEHGVVSETIPPDVVMEFRQGLDNEMCLWDEMPTDLGASLVLVVQLDTYPTTAAYTEQMRRMNPIATLMVRDANGDHLWPDSSAGYEVMSPVPMGVEALSEDKEAELRELAYERLVERICRCFHDTTPAEQPQP